MVNKLAIMNVYSRQPECKCNFAALVIDAAIAATLRERCRQFRATKIRDASLAEMSWSTQQVAFMLLPKDVLPEEAKKALESRESVIIDEPEGTVLNGKTLTWCHMIADSEAVYWRAMTDDIEMWTGFIFFKDLQEL